MLKSILSKEACAKCRICCSFVEADVWEAPAFNEREYGIIVNNERIDSNAFKKIGNEYKAIYEFKDEKEILLCPCLDEKNGCMIEDDKPFECKIWPIRVFKVDGELRLGVCKSCPELLEETNRKLEILMNEGFRDKVIEEVKKNPSIISEYTQDYVLYDGI